MKKKITIAIDAMGGENAPRKNIEGLNLFLKKNNKHKDFIVHLYGNESAIKKEFKRYNISEHYTKIIHTDDTVSDEETVLKAIKSSKNTSMWNCVQAQLDEKADISLSAGNTGVLLVISKMILKTMNKVDKPALAGLWPSKKGMTVVLDLGANIECNEKNLIDFSELGSALQNNIFPIILIINNGSYGTIRMHQEKLFPKRISGTNIKNPDFVNIAKSYGFYSARINKTNEFYEVFEKALKSNKGAIIDIITSINLDQVML